MEICCTCPTVNISQLNFKLLICFAKYFIWTTLKAILFLYLEHPQIPDFQIAVSWQNIILYINGKLIYLAFRSCMNLSFKKLVVI